MRRATPSTAVLEKVAGSPAATSGASRSTGSASAWPAACAGVRRPGTTCAVPAPRRARRRVEERFRRRERRARAMRLAARPAARRRSVAAELVAHDEVDDDRASGDRDRDRRGGDEREAGAKVMARAARTRRRAPCGSAAARRPPPSCGAGSRCTRRASSSEAEVVAPDALEDDRAREHLARVAQEELEQRELGPGQLDRSRSPRRTSRVPGSSSRSANRSDSPRPRRRVRRSSARRRASSSSSANGFDEVVVGARVEPGDAVPDLVARRQHQDGQRGAAARGGGGTPRARPRAA